MTQTKWWKLGAAAALSMSFLAACGEEEPLEEEPLEDVEDEEVVE